MPRYLATSVLMGVMITGALAPTTAAATRGTNPDSVIADAASLGPTELVDDPGFEEGPANPSWQQEGTLVATYPLITTEHPFAGIYGAWLCGYPTCDDRLWQSIGVPQDVESASLTYMFQIGTEETAPVCFDSMNIGLEDAEGGLGPRSNYCNNNLAGSWQPVTLDVTAFAQAHEGQQIVVSAVTAGDATLNTNFFLDDISLQVTTADPVTHDLTVAAAGTGTGTVASSPAGISCGGTCSAAFDEGTEVVLTASPASNSTFTGWSGDCTGTGTCTISMTEARNVTAAFDLNPIRRPDGMIRKSTESSFAGNNIYNSTGSGQSKTSSGRRTTSKTFIVRIQNDGNVTESFLVKGAGSSNGFKVAYFAGTTVITAAVVEGSFKLTDLTAGATRSIKVKITATRSAFYGTTKNVAITSRSQVLTAKADTVKAAMKAVR